MRVVRQAAASPLWIVNPVPCYANDLIYAVTRDLACPCIIHVSPGVARSDCCVHAALATALAEAGHTIMISM